MDLIRKRIDYIDIFKGIGIIYMIFGHVYFGDYFDTYIHGFHMPIFFFVAGYFFRADKYKNFGYFLLHELKTLMLPYTVFVFLCQPLHYLYTGHYSIKYFILSFFTSNYNRIDVAGAYWFLLCLFTLHIVFYFIDRYLKSEVVKIIFIVSCSLFGCLSSIKLPLCLNSALAVLPLIYLGQCANKYKDKEIVKQIFNISPILIVALLVINMFLIELNGNVSNRTNHYSNLILYWINCITALICYFNLSIYISRWNNRILGYVRRMFSYIGKNSIVYLVINELVIFTVRYLFSFVFAKLGASVEMDSFYLLKIFVGIITLVIISLVAAISNKTFIKVIFGRY